MRVHLCGGRMTLHEADVLEFCLCACEGVTEVRVFDRTADAVIMYDDGGRVAVIRALAAFSFEKAEAKGLIPEHTSRALNREYEDKLASAVMRRIISKTLLPLPVRSVLTVIKSAKYITQAFRRCGTESCRSRSWMPLPCRCPCCAVISTQQVPSCSC